GPPPSPLPATLGNTRRARRLLPKTCLPRTALLRTVADTEREKPRHTGTFGFLEHFLRGTATGIRTPVSGLRIRRPSPLDDSGERWVSLAVRIWRARLHLPHRKAVTVAGGTPHEVVDRERQVVDPERGLVARAVPAS